MIHVDIAEVQPFMIRRAAYGDAPIAKDAVKPHDTAVYQELGLGIRRKAAVVCAGDDVPLKQDVGFTEYLEVASPIGMKDVAPQYHVLR